MATRSTIAMVNQDGTVTGIYCHWDGYLSNNGRLLQEHYNTEARVRELLALGDLSSLGENTGKKVDFNDYDSHYKQCVAYGRDRGETGVEARTFDNWSDLLENFGEDYNYLYVPGAGWSVEYYDDSKQLSEALALDDADA